MTIDEKMEKHKLNSSFGTNRLFALQAHYSNVECYFHIISYYFHVKIKYFSLLYKTLREAFSLLCF